MKKLLLIAFLLFPIVAYSGPIPITGTISAPDGSTLTGSVVFTLSYGAARDTTNNNMVVAKTVTFPVIQGQIRGNAKIVPNDILQPSNTYYDVTYLDSYGAQIAENFFYISGSSFDLGSAIPTSVTTNNLSFATLGNYWTRANDPQGNGRVNLYPATTTDRVLVGLSTSDDTDQSDIITSGCLATASGGLNASIGTFCYIPTSQSMQLTSGATGSGTTLPLTFHLQRPGVFDQEALAIVNSSGNKPYFQLTASDENSDAPSPNQSGFRNNNGTFQIAQPNYNLGVWTNAITGGNGVPVFLTSSTSGVAGTSSTAAITYAQSTNSMTNTNYLASTTGIKTINHFDYFSSGTNDAPTRAQAPDRIRYANWAYNGSSYSVVSEIDMYMSGNGSGWTSGTNPPGVIALSTGTSGGSVVEAVRIEATQNMDLGVTTDASAGTSGVRLYVRGGNDFGAETARFESKGTTSSIQLTASSGSITSAGYLLGGANYISIQTANGDANAFVKNNALCGAGGCFSVTASGIGESFRADGTNSANTTSVSLYSNGVFYRVFVGAADSCTAGYRCLRILN